MKYLLIGMITLCIVASCGISSKTPIISHQKLDFEQWQKEFAMKISTEMEMLSDTLHPFVKLGYKYMIDNINRKRKDHFLSQHDSALQKLGNIPVNASTYFVEYHREGEVSLLYYGMFWIKGNKYKGVWQDENWTWRAMETNSKNLKKLSNFHTMLNHPDLIYSGGGEIYITEFNEGDIKEVNFIALLTLPQLLVTEKVFQ